MLTCKQVVELITQSVDRPLRWRERLGLWLHVLMCRYCFRFKIHIKWLHYFCKNETKAIENELYEEHSLSPEARKRIAEKISEHLK